jgi:hypothetical protein
MENAIQPAAGLKTPVTYYGGKQNMMKNILPLIVSLQAPCQEEN